MGARVEMVGRRFNRLKVKSKSCDRSKSGSIYWNCVCDCGKEVKVLGTSLRYGSTQSCGCLRTERVKNTIISHGQSNSPTYASWGSMIQRCNNPNNPEYNNYGGRGVTVCDRWDFSKGGSFENFLEDMGIRPTGTSLNRINCAMIYSKETCEWATASMQGFDKRSHGNKKEGVQWRGDFNKWIAKITVNYKQIYLGSFERYEDAVAAREQAELKYFGRIKKC